jgi:DNA (cytosine-5)-methyltransferase 1
MIARSAFTKVSIEIDGYNSYLCANVCKWHLKEEDHCDLFNQDLRKEKWQSKYSRCIECHMGTVTTKERFALLEPFGLKVNHTGGDRVSSLNEPLGTITAKRDSALVQPFVINSGHSSAKDISRSVDEPLTTIVTKAEHYLIEPDSGLKLDIRFRMLKNHELKRAQGFPDDYKILGNTTEQTKQIGNAVPVNTAKALTMAIMGEGKK